MVSSIFLGPVSQTIKAFQLPASDLQVGQPVLSGVGGLDDLARIDFERSVDVQAVLLESFPLHLRLHARGRRFMIRTFFSMSAQQMLVVCLAMSHLLPSFIRRPNAEALVRADNTRSRPWSGRKRSFRLLLDRDSLQC
jgi:hypothetical protein